VRSTVLKDGHVFAVHILNPKEPEEELHYPELEQITRPATDDGTEKSELEKPEKGM
jgi:hypothetical protein